MESEEEKPRQTNPITGRRLGTFPDLLIKKSLKGGHTQSEIITDAIEEFYSGKETPNLLKMRGIRNYANRIISESIRSGRFDSHFVLRPRRYRRSQK
ncbi:hypothetical protein UFOVP978_53 [uncultured Caudovirales phage]|uniref:Uncharacterized protein n=1 Tax=uncultured Caudovirales phage TaxID=2100421 RepID=A0A6J5PXK7_9CAUD|nr:hypothetical protein UFOVP978_53 [uncultured Caudovirales phage]